MSDKKKAVETVGDQINSVIDNIADKIDGPSEIVSNMAEYGFGAYVEYIYSVAIVSTSIGVLILVAGVGFAILASKYNIHDDDAIRKATGDTEGMRGYDARVKDYVELRSFSKGFMFVISAILIIAGLIVIGGYMPEAMCPDGVAVKEITKNIGN